VVAPELIVELLEFIELSFRVSGFWSGGFAGRLEPVAVSVDLVEVGAALEDWGHAADSQGMQFDGLHYLGNFKSNHALAAHGECFRHSLQGPRCWRLRNGLDLRRVS